MSSREGQIQLGAGAIVASLLFIFVAIPNFVSFLVRTKHMTIAIVSAVAVPLLLYVFFAHVAGVAIPQGNFVRLP